MPRAPKLLQYPASMTTSNTLLLYGNDAKFLAVCVLYSLYHYVTRTAV